MFDRKVCLAGAKHLVASLGQDSMVSDVKEFVRDKESTEAKKGLHLKAKNYDKESSFDEELSDQEIVSEVLSGNSLAYEKLVLRYQARAHSVAYGVLRNFDDAQDVVQDAFHKAYRNLSSFKGESSFYTWFYRIVFNLSIDLTRKKYRKTESQIEDQSFFDSLGKESSLKNEGSITFDPEKNLDNIKLGEKIREAIAKLSIDHRTVIILREIEDRSYQEIGEIIGCSTGTVMSRLFHARKNLQILLSEYADLKA